MTVPQALILGILQGLTEFLPVSSSGHLVVAQHYIEGFHQPGILFDVMFHMGTLFAVLIYYKRDILVILKSLFIGFHFKGKYNDRDSNIYKSQRRLAVLILAGTLPTFMIGFLFKDHIGILFTSVKFTASMLIVTGILLAFADRIKGKKRDANVLTLKDSLLIGLVQGLSITPGISRSGSTITAGLFMGIDGKEAARFSFLLSIPAILGATALEIPAILHIKADDILACTIGTLSAMITGIFAIRFLIRILKQEKLRYFAYYCWCLGSMVILLNLLSSYTHS
ncbi:MAG: undecaprenyl-diphosphatase UppP [Thermodesulfobacteriota bacterium]|nr:undecaprenyl-diphosphatase UppP [Thermodesulfobacteriota bacterium]